MKQTFSLVVLLGLVLLLGGLLFLYQTLEKQRQTAPLHHAEVNPKAAELSPVVPRSPAAVPGATPLTNPKLSVRITAGNEDNNPRADVGAPPAVPAPGAEITRWLIRDQRDFNEENSTENSLAPWYTGVTAGLIRVFPADAALAPADGRGVPVLALYGQENHPNNFSLSPRVPHRLRWTVGVRMGSWGSRVVQYSATGFQLIPQTDPKGASLERDRVYTIAAERLGGKIIWTLNGGMAASFEIPADDRSPLTIAATRDNREIQLTRSQLELAAGDELQDPLAAGPVEGQPAKAVAWQRAFEDHFDDAKAIKKYLLVDGGALEWHESYKALFLKNDENGGGQLYAAVPQSLPGDLRVRMRVLRPKAANQINIGMLFNIKGSLKAEDGYFAEFKMGQVQIKLQDHLKVQADAPTPATPDRWVRVELRKMGGKISVYLEDKEVATWTDPHPLKDAGHDLFSLYIWDERQVIDDLEIDRNPADPVKPLEDNPADPQNAVNGTRTPATTEPNQDQF